MRAGSTVGLRGGKASVGRCERGRGGTGKGSRSWASRFLGKHPQDRLWDCIWEQGHVCMVLQSLINDVSLDGTRYQR